MLHRCGSTNLVSHSPSFLCRRKRKTHTDRLICRRASQYPTPQIDVRVWYAALTAACPTCKSFLPQRSAPRIKSWLRSATLHGHRAAFSAR